jgi:hypothetical protein
MLQTCRTYGAQGIILVWYTMLQTCRTYGAQGIILVCYFAFFHANTVYF